MFRRKFLQIFSAASVSGLAPLQALSANAGETATYLVKGFTCITCATGLDTLLGREKGILSSHSTYPEGRVVVRFDPQHNSDQAIRGFIAELGFTVLNSKTSS